jgi:hypothetical protein
MTVPETDTWADCAKESVAKLVTSHRNTAKIFLIE